MIYFSYFTIIGMLSLFKLDRYRGMICACLTFLCFSLSYPSGGDWIGYFENYNCLVNGVCIDGSPDFEFGFNIFVNVFGQFGFLIYNSVIVAFNIYCLNRFSRLFDNRAFVYFAILSFMFWMIYIEAIRQSIAISFLILALPYLFQKSIIKYSCVIILASFFHTTALVCFLFILPCMSLRFSKLSLYSAISLSLTFLVIPFVMLNAVYSLLQPGSLAQQKLSYYLESEAYRPQLSAGVGTVFDFILIMIVILTVIKIKNKSYNEKKDNLNFVLPGVVLYISFSIIIGKMMPVMTRIGWYGIPFLIILLNANVSNSVFFDKIVTYAKIPLRKTFIYLFLISQISRPVLYEHSRYGIVNQVTIFQQMDYLDDKGLFIKAKEKCQVLHNMGLEYLCSI